MNDNTIVGGISENDGAGTERFTPFVADLERMSPLDQQLGNEVGMLFQSRRDRKLEDDFMQAVRDGMGDDDETRFSRCDKFFSDRYGIDTTRGAIINVGSGYKMKPFADPSAYEQTLISLATRGYEAIASDRYRDLLKAERMPDAKARRDELIRQGNVQLTKVVDNSAAGMQAGMMPTKTVARTDEEIDADVEEYRRTVLGENFIAVFEAMRPELSDEGESIVRDVVKNGSLPADREMDFKRLCAEDWRQGEVVSYLCNLAKPSESDVWGAMGRGMVREFNNLANQAGEKIGQALYRFGAGFDAMDYAWAGSSADRMARMNRDERDEYERLRSEGVAESKALDKVSGRMQNRYRNELLAIDDRVRERRVALALEDLRARREWEHYDYWENAFIGAATTIPYMAVTAVPYAGFAVNVLSHMQDVEDEIIREGGDPTKARAARAIGAVTWAAIEKLELKGFGRAMTKLEKTVMWRHLWQGQVKRALGELGTATAKTAPELLLNWASETGQEGLQDAVQAVERDVGLGKGAKETIADAVKSAWDGAKESAGTMTILTAVTPVVGAVARAPFQRRKLSDRESLKAFLERKEQFKNMVAGTTVDDTEDEVGRQTRVARAMKEASDVWSNSKDPMEAMAKLEEIGYTEDQAVKIAELFDMQNAIKDNAAGVVSFEERFLKEIDKRLETETDPKKIAHLKRRAEEAASMIAAAYGQARLAGNAFRIGNDTTFDVKGFFSLVNPGSEVFVDEVDLPGQAQGTKVTKVTRKFKDADGNEQERTVSIVTDESSPDINTHDFGQSVAAEMARSVGERFDDYTLRDGRKLTVDEFKALDSVSKMTYAVTADQWDSMTPEERENYVQQYDLKEGGNYRILDDAGKEIFNSQGLITIKRAKTAHTRVGGNYTLAHEDSHYVVSVARALGVFGDRDGMVDDGAGGKKLHPFVEVMRKAFGGPTGANELWDEDTMANAYSAYLRGKFDFQGLGMSAEEQGLLARIFKAITDFIRDAYRRVFHRDLPQMAHEVKTREQAQEAVFEGIRSGDFSGLSAFAGIKFAEDEESAVADGAQKAQIRGKAASDEKTNIEPTAESEERGGASAGASGATASAISAEERVKRTHAVQKGVKTAASSGIGGEWQQQVQAQLDRIEAKLAQLSSVPGAAMSVPGPRVTPKGEETRATPQGGVKFKIAWQWVPRADLVTSDKPEYPQEFQPRDRQSRVASDLQVIENTRPGRFDPMKLAYSYDSDGGAPIVAGGNVVLSGNGRSMMLARLSQENRYGEYLDKIGEWAEEYGIGRPPTGMVEPVLVQRITSTDRRGDLLKIAELSNQAKILTRSEAETAEADAKLITPEMMRMFRPSEDGDLLAASNAEFMQSFIASAPDAKGLTNADGTPTDQCERRVRNALLSAVLGTDQNTRALLKTLLEKRGDLGLGDVYRALINASGALLANRKDKASFDLLPHIRAAVGQYVAWRSARQSDPRMTLDAFLATTDMFQAAPSKETEAVVRLLEAGRFGRVIAKYNELVAQKGPDAQASFFAEDTAYQTLAKAERSVLIDGEAPVTMDPANAMSAEPLQSPPAETVPAPVEVPQDEKPVPAETNTDDADAPFEPQPLRRGTATIPASNAEKIVAYQVNAAGEAVTEKKVLPVGAYNLLRGPYDVRRPPKKSVQDKAGRGLGIGFSPEAHDSKGQFWGDIFPHFQGNKTEMANRTSQAIRKNMSKAERDSYHTVVDYFGGGGCWGLYHALTNFEKVDHLVINEWEGGRIAKIRLLHERGEAVADEARKLILETVGPELKALCRVGDNGGESGAGTTIANKLETLIGRFGEDPDVLGLVFAVIDCAHTMLKNRLGADGKPSFDAGFDAVIDNLREDGRKAKAAADAFKARGGRITYRQGDAASFAEAPKGTDVVAVCDPPYYLTAGYNGQVSVPIDAGGMGWDYKTTRKLIEQLVDAGDAMVYTDEAWWFKENYTPDQQEDLFGGGSPFAQEQEILLGIINALDHFDVAGRVVGRQEVLGIHHGHRVDQGISDDEGAGRGADDDGHVADVQRGQADGRGDALGDARASVRRVVAGAEGQDAGILGDGAGRGREGDAEQVALAREIAAVEIEDAVRDAGYEVTPEGAAVIRATVRQVRDDRLADYARAVDAELDELRTLPRGRNLEQGEYHQDDSTADGYREGVNRFGERYSVRAVGKYAGELRRLAWGLKLGHHRAMEDAARLMAPMIPDNAVIVPMPNHEGKPISTMILAYYLSGEKDSDVDIVPALEAEPHESNYKHKKRTRGKSTAIVMHRTDAEIPQGRPVVIIDNVVASGATYKAAQKVLPQADLVTLADATRGKVKFDPSLQDLHLEMSKPSGNLAESLNAAMNNPSAAMSTEEMIRMFGSHTIDQGKRESVRHAKYLGDADLSNDDSARYFKNYLKNISPSPAPKNLSKGTPREALKWFLEHMVGRTYKFDVPGIGIREFTPTPGHIGKLICSGENKGIINKKYEGKWIDAVLRGDISGDDVNGWDYDRARELPLIDAVLNSFDAVLYDLSGKSPCLVFIKKFLRKDGKVNTIVMKIADGNNDIGPITAHLKDATITWLKNKKRLVITNDGQLYNTGKVNSAIDAHIPEDSAEGNSRGRGGSIAQSSVKVKRESVRRGRGGAMKAHDLALAFVASRYLAGKDTKVEDADKMLKNVGLRGVEASSLLSEAKALADRNRERLRERVESRSPDLMAELAMANLRDRADEAFSNAIMTGASASDPDIGVAMQRTADAFAARELQAAKGFTAAQMEAELPISLAEAVFAVAEYEKSPEEKARLEAAKAKREEEKARREADGVDGESPVEEAERLARETAYTEPTAEERAYFDQLMNRAKAADEARAQEELRKRLAEEKRKSSEPDAVDGEGDGADEGDEGEGAGDGSGEESLPFATVKRIAPVFEGAELFSQFIVEWTTDHVLKKHPELVNRADLWKSPVAVRELIKTAQHILRDLSRQTLGSPSISAARNAVDQMIVNLADYKTFYSVRRNVAFIYDRIHDNALRMSRRQLVNELIYGKRDSEEGGPGFKGLRQLAGIKGRFSATAEAKGRAIDAKTELWCRWLIPYLTMSEDKLRAEEDRLRAIITRHDTEDEAYGYDKEDDTHYVEAKDRLALLNMYGGMIRWMPGKIIDAREHILEQVNGKRQEFVAAREAREAEDKELRDAIIAAVEAGASDDYRHGGETADRIDRYLYSMNGNLTLEMQNLIRYCKDGEKRQKALVAIEDLATMISLGTEKYRVTLATARKEINDGLAAYYGNAEKGIRHLMHDQLPEDVAKRIFTQSRQKVQTYGQLLQLYATTIQADYKENAEKHGRTATLPLMEETLTDQDKAFHAWAVNWYASNREALSDAVEEMTGLGVSSPDRLYCPARMERDPDGFSADAVAWSPIPSALNRRVAHGLDFNEQVNFLNCLMEQAEVRAQTIGYGMTGIRLRDIIAHHDLQKAVRKHVGRADMKLVTDHVKDVLVQDAEKKDVYAWLAPLNVARKWMARFYLSGNIPSAIKQLASMPVWANALLGGQEVGLKRCLGYLTSVGTEAGQQAISDLIHSDGFKARYQMGWSEEVQNLMTHPSKNRIMRYVEKVYDKGMVINKGVDAVSCLWMAQGFYRDARDMFEKRGLDPETAKANALALTWSVCENGQQSGRIENMNRAQRKGGSLVSAVFQFKTAFLLQNNYVIQAIRDCRAGTPGARGRLARALFINTVYIPAFVAVVNAAWSAIRGDPEAPEDPDKMPNWLRDFIWSMIDGVTAPLFMTGALVHSTWNMIFGKTGYDDNAALPAIEGAVRLGKHAGRALADVLSTITPMEVAEEVTPEKVREDLFRVLGDMAAPVRHARQIIKNREE